MRRSSPINRLILVLMTVAVMLTTLVGDALGATYYVAKQPDSQNIGTMQDPWTSIERVNAANPSLRDGDTILFKAGDTFKGRLVISASGTANQPIVFGRYPVGTSDKDPILSPPENTNSSLGNVYITGSYIRLEHLDIRGFKNYAVKVWDENPFIGNKENVTITHCSIRKTLGDQSASTSGIIVAQSRGVVIKNNIIHRGLSYGLDLKDSERCQLVGNTIYDCRGALIRGENVAYLTIEKNLCFTSSNGPKGTAIHLSLSNGGSFAGSPGAGIAIHSNAIASCLKGMRFSNAGTNRRFTALQLMHNTLVANDVQFTLVSAAEDTFGTANLANNISYLPQNCSITDQKHFEGNAYKSSLIAYRNNNYWVESPEERANV